MVQNIVNGFDSIWLQYLFRTLHGETEENCEIFPDSFGFVRLYFGRLCTCLINPEDGAMME